VNNKLKNGTGGTLSYILNTLGRSPSHNYLYWSIFLIPTLVHRYNYGKKMVFAMVILLYRADTESCELERSLTACLHLSHTFLVYLTSKPLIPCKETCPLKSIEASMPFRSMLGKVRLYFQGIYS
jgi:hypothetical protein